MDDFYTTGLLINLLSECEVFPFLGYESSDEDTEKNAETRNLPLRILDYVERTIPNLSHKQFQCHFRISRQTFLLLLPAINQLIKKPNENGRKQIDPERQLLAVLWILATPDSYR